jgi:protein YibB
MKRLIPQSLAAFCSPVGVTGPMTVDPGAEADVSTVVTAFFDTGREDWRVGGAVPSRYRRGTRVYLDAFERLAALKNPMVIFTEPRFAEPILAARRAAGLETLTRVFIVADLFAVPPVAALMEAVANRMTPRFRRFVWLQDLPEFNEPRYVGLVCLKQVFVTTAIECGAIATAQTAWLDFGYCRNGDGFETAEPWRFDAAGRMNLFHVAVLDETPIFEVVRSGQPYFLANQMVGPTELWSEYADNLDAALRALLACGLVDDEQTLMLIAWRNAPEKFYVHPLPPGEWFSTLRLYRNGVQRPSMTLPQAKISADDSAWRQEVRAAWKRTRRRMKAQIKSSIRIG